MGSPTRRICSKLGRTRSAAVDSCEPSEVNVVYVHGKPEVKVNLRRDSSMTAPSSSSGEADKTADEAPTMQAEAAQDVAESCEERRAREIAEGILGLRRDSNPEAQTPTTPSAKPQTPIALEDCDESRVNEIADGINRLISNVEKKRATHHVPQHSKPRAVAQNNVEPASPTCPIGVWKDGKISVSLQAERMFYTIVGERNVPSTVTARDGISVASEVTMEGAAQMNAGRKCRPPPPKNAVQRPPPPPPRRRSSSFTKSPGTPSYPPPRRQLPKPSTLPPPPLTPSGNTEQQMNLSESCPALNKEQSCDATRSSAVSGTPCPKRMPPPPPPPRRPNVAKAPVSPKKRSSSFSMSCPENIASECRQDDATKSSASTQKDASFVRPRRVQGRIRTPGNADAVEDTPQAKSMPPPRAPRSCPSTPVRIGSPNSAFSPMPPASGQGIDKQKSVKSALSSDRSNRSQLKAKESRIDSTSANDQAGDRQKSAKTALSSDQSNRSPVKAKEFRIGNNRMVKDYLPKQGQFDPKGRCTRHPSEVLAKKKLLGRGWKIIQDRCPQCKQQQQRVKKMKKRASEGSSDSHARSVSGASYIRMQSLSGAAAEMLGNDSGGSDRRCGNDGKVHPTNDSKRVPPSPWSETKVEDVPKKKPTGAPPRRKKDHHAKAPTVRPRSFRMAPPPRQEKFLYEVQLRNNF